MGQALDTGISVEVEQDSILEPGKKSCISGPLPEWVNADLFLATYFEANKDPLLGPEEAFPPFGPVLKDGGPEVTIDGPNEYTVRIWFDGEKLKANHWPDTDKIPEGEHVLQQSVKFEWRKEECHIVRYELPSLATHLYPDRPHEGHTVYHADRNIIETWAIHNGNRYASPIIKGIAEVAIVAVLQKLRYVVTLEAEQDSPSGGGLKSVMSTSMDEFVTADEFFDAWVECRKGSDKIMFPLATHTEVSDSEFWTARPDHAGGEVIKLNWSREDRHITRTGEGFEIHWQVHTDPVRLEVWTILLAHHDRPRVADRILKKINEPMVNDCIRQASKSQGGIASWLGF